jgi:hypothetical protein
MYVSNTSAWWIIGALIGEAVFLFQLDALKNSLITNGYDDKNNPPLSEVHQQSTRYLMFEKQLKNKNVDAKSVIECNELIDMQIDISATDTNLFQKQITFLIGLLAGILATLWKGLDVKSLILISFAIIGIALIFSVAASILPSKTAKLKELKYFMLLYVTIPSPKTVVFRCY